jgi:hypothetical protein
LPEKNRSSQTTAQPWLKRDCDSTKAASDLQGAISRNKILDYRRYDLYHQTAQTICQGSRGG